MTIQTPLLTLVPQFIQSASASFTLSLDNAGAYIRLTNLTGGANEAVVTVPTDASVPFPLGTCVWLYPSNGWVSLTAPSVTITRKTIFPLNLLPRGVTFLLRKVATDEWELSTPEGWNPAQVFAYRFDPLSDIPGHPMGGVYNGSGSGFTFNTNTSGVSAGSLNTGTSTSGNARIFTDIQAINSVSGSGRWSLQADQISLSAAASTAQNFTARVGFLNVITNAAPTEGAYIHHHSSVTNWQLNVMDGGTNSNLDLAQPVTTPFDLQILLKPGSACQFFIDSVLNALGSSPVIGPVGFGANIIKSAGSTSRSLRFNSITVIGELY